MTDEEEEKKIYYIKVILLGEAGIGKTNLINTYTEEQYNPNELSTTNPCQSLHTIELKNKKLNIAFWDTMGQEKHRAITKTFIKGSNIVIFVYDITRRDTFLELNYWVNATREELGNEEVIFGVAANKIDLFDQSQVDKEEGEDYAKSINAVFFETSAKSNIGFKNLVNNLLEQLLLNKNIIGKEEENQDIEQSFHLKDKRHRKQKEKKQYFL